MALNIPVLWSLLSLKLLLNEKLMPKKIKQIIITKEKAENEMRIVDFKY